MIGGEQLANANSQAVFCRDYMGVFFFFHAAHSQSTVAGLAESMQPVIGNLREHRAADTGCAGDAQMLARSGRRPFEFGNTVLRSPLYLFVLTGKAPCILSKH